MTNETRYVYHEEGGHWLVDVLSDTQKQKDGGTFRVVKLRCLKTLRKSPHHLEIPEGTVWEADARLGYEAYSVWHLLPEHPDDYELV